MLLIASLTATAAIPAYFARGEVTLDNAARLLVDDLRQAQIRAVYRNAPVEVHFDADGDGYTVVDIGAINTMLADPSTISRRYSRDAVFEGVRLTALELGSEHCLTFQGDGSTGSGGGITMSYRGEARTVLIEPGRGTIRAPELEISLAHGRL